MANPTLNLYILRQDENPFVDSYSTVLVAAESKQQAKKMHPESLDMTEVPEDHSFWNSLGLWASSPDKVKAKKIGTTNNFRWPCIILTEKY